MGQKNQIYCKWVRVFPNPDDENELFIIVSKDKPMSSDTMLDFDARFKDTDVIITVTKLIRRKGKLGQRE